MMFTLFINIVEAMWYAVVVIIVAGVLITAFMIIARKGRALRTERVLPPQASSAFLEAVDGSRNHLEQENHFYLGRKQDSDVVLPKSKHDYEVCIFYHRKRFAFQTISDTEDVRINGEERQAGYLTNGDVLEIAGEKFVFRTITHTTGASSDDYDKQIKM
jgi:hypothetical protein